MIRGHYRPRGYHQTDDVSTYDLADGPGLGRRKGMGIHYVEPPKAADAALAREERRR